MLTSRIGTVIMRVAVSSLGKVAVRVLPVNATSILTMQAKSLALFHRS